jgi:tRNA pseudouridine38-40 synthase
MRNIMMLVEYDGTNYHGFQKQAGSGLATIQEALEEALHLLTGEQITVTGAGRTDAGVHALGQTINFYTNSTIPVERFAYALNTFLRSDIITRSAREVPEDFHAQFKAISKSYRYVIYNALIPTALQRLYSFHVSMQLDLAAMQKAAGFLVGEHDFAAFRASGSSAKTSVRHVTRLEVQNKEPYIYITAEANGFLYNMVRIIAGTLIYVGKGKLTPEDVRAALVSGDRTMTGPTLPPHGLFMLEVRYNN